MRKLLVALALSLSLTGCAMFSGMYEPIHKVEKVDSVKSATELAQSVIDEANAARYSINTTIKDRVANKVWTWEQGQKYLNQSMAYGLKIEAAQVLLDAGDVVGSENEAELVRALLVKLSAEVARQASKETK